MYNKIDELKKDFDKQVFTTTEWVRDGTDEEVEHNIDYEKIKAYIFDFIVPQIINNNKN